MGRTLQSFRPALDTEIDTWKEYKRGLRSEDKVIFDKIMGFARKFADAGSLAARPILSEVLFLSILMEQQKIIEKLKKRVKILENSNN